MKRLFAILTLVVILLTGCAAPNVATNAQTTNTEQTQTNTDSTTTAQLEDDAETETIARFELNETFQNLLDEVNTVHESVKMYNRDYEQYAGQHNDPDFSDTDYMQYLNQPLKTIYPNTLLTLEQVTEDLEIYYKALRTQYGAYTYFGDDEVFRPAIDAVIADCAAMEYITIGSLQDSLLQHLSFVKDAHFLIGGWVTGEHLVPFFFRDVLYQKTENGFETMDGKLVASVEGYDDLDELFQLSLTIEGDLVYYPILLEEVGFKEFWTGATIQCSVQTLTVQYTDGSAEELHPQPFKLSVPTQSESVSIQEKNGIPFINAPAISYPYNGIKLIDAARDYRDSDILIIDFRKCEGGDVSTVPEWAQAHTQHTLWGNSWPLAHGVPFSIYEYATDHTDAEFVPMDNVRIILTSKYAASGAEMFIDTSYNMENTLIVGENTRGWFTASIRGTMTLPNTGLYVSFGPHLFLHPDGDYFEEYRGFLPDIWCPAAEAEEAVMNFIAKNTTVTYEEAKR